MTLDNRPSTTNDIDEDGDISDLNELIADQNQVLVAVPAGMQVEFEDEPADEHQANIEDHHRQQRQTQDQGQQTEADQQPLYPAADQLPDFTQTIEQINASLNSIQEDISTLALRSGSGGAENAGDEFDAAVQQLRNESNQVTQGEEEDQFEGGIDREPQFINEIDKNLDKISEALDKLDSENDDLQERLRELLEVMRAANNPDLQ